MSLNDRVATTLRTAGLSARSFAELVGCHYTTVYRVIRSDDDTMHGTVRAAIERVLTRLEELVDLGYLPFNAKMSREEQTASLQRLLATDNN